MATMLTMSGYQSTLRQMEAPPWTFGGRRCVPGVILMDAQMPGLSGTQLIEKLRARSLARLYLISAATRRRCCCGRGRFSPQALRPESLTRLIEEQEASSKPAPPKGLDPEEQVVNPGTLAQLREMMPEAALRQIYEAIIADVGKRTTLLEVAVAKGDWPETRRIGHAIKGGGSMAGATQMHALDT